MNGSGSSLKGITLVGSASTSLLETEVWFNAPELGSLLSVAELFKPVTGQSPDDTSFRSFLLARSTVARNFQPRP